MILAFEYVITLSEAIELWIFVGICVICLICLAIWLICLAIYGLQMLAHNIADKFKKLFSRKENL